MTTTHPSDDSAPVVVDLRQGPEKRSWQGQWIWLDAAAHARNAYGFFRRRFQTAADGTARFDITADSFYELHVDGVRIARGPARSHLHHYSFDRHELRLERGEHVVAVLVHHIGVENASIMTGGPGLLVDVTIEQETFGSDATWRCAPAEAWRRDLPCLMSHFGFWEERDLQRLPQNWTASGFDDAAWAGATVLGRPPCSPWTRLIQPDIPSPRLATVPVREVVAAGTWSQRRVTEDSPAKRQSIAGGWLADATTIDIPSKQAAARQRKVMPRPPALPAPLSSAEDQSAEGEADGVWLTLDFGRTVSGYPSLVVESPRAGIVVDLSYDDVVTPDGAVNPERSYARLTDRFRLALGLNTIRPVHPRGFRYVTVDVEGDGCSLHRAEAIEETYPFAAPAAFDCSDPALPRQARVAAETMRICATDAFTDCPGRERVQWMEDLYLHARVAAYVFGDTKLLRRALFGGAQNALPDGRINGFMPSERTGCAFASSSLMWLHCLVDYWLFAGDEPGCRQLLPTAQRLLDFVASRTDDDGLMTDWPSGQFWDWSPIDSRGCLLLTNAAYAWVLSRLAAHELFRQGLGTDPGARAERVRSAAHARFSDAKRQLYRDAAMGADRPIIVSQHANAMAVLAGVCPKSERAALLRRLIDPARLGPLPVGEQLLDEKAPPDPDRIVPVGTLWFGHFLCQALFEADMAEEALAQMRHLWGPFDQCPTFPETRQPSANTTQCHGWSAGPAFLLPAYVLGVRPAGPGWRSIVVAPQAGDLDSASGTVPTPHGPVKVSWRRGAADALELDIDAPTDVTVVRASSPTPLPD